MKRKFVIFVGGIAIVVASAVNLNIGSNKGTLSDLALANIEAMARGETDPPCSGTCGWGLKDGLGWYKYCNICKDLATTLQNELGGNWCCDSCSSTAYCGG